MAKDKAYSDRPDRVCIGCGQRDKAPRDVVALPDGNVSYYHMDCHVLIADCEVCAKVLALAGGEGPKGKKNEELVKVLTSAEASKSEIMTTDDASGEYARAVERGDMLPPNALSTPRGGK
jgi:hypothetical protein